MLLSLIQSYPYYLYIYAVKKNLDTKTLQSLQNKKYINSTLHEQTYVIVILMTTDVFFTVMASNSDEPFFRSA